MDTVTYMEIQKLNDSIHQLKEAVDYIGNTLIKKGVLPKPTEVKT